MDALERDVEDLGHVMEVDKHVGLKPLELGRLLHFDLLLGGCLVWRAYLPSILAVLACLSAMSLFL